MKFFRWLSMSLVVMLTVLVGAPVMNTVVQAQEDNEPYIIATDTTFAPFEYQDENGDFVGIDMDLLEAIAEDQGFEYEIRPIGFNAALQAVESGQVDGMIAGMGITEERQESFDFSDPYYEAGVQFAVLEDSEIESLEDLEGQNVAVKTGTTGMAAAESVADEFGFTISTFEDSVNMYEDLQAGNSVAVIEDYPVMAYAAQTGGIPLRFIGEQMEITDYGFAVQTGENPELIEMFNAGLANVRESGEFAEIVKTHLGDADMVNADPSSEEEEGSEEVVADPDRTYIIGTDTTFAPFEFVGDDGEYVGIDMDLLAAIASDQGFNYEIRPLGFNAALQAVEAGQIDGMIAGMGITEEREESFDFSNPYYEAGVQFAVLEDSDVETLEDLEGQNVAVKTGTTGMATAEAVADEYGFTISTFEDSVNMYEDLQAGNSVAVIEDYPVMAYAAQTGGIPLRFIGEQMELTDYGFAVSAGKNPELVALFNQGLSNIQASGEYDTIISNYLGEEELEESSSSGFFGLIEQNGRALLNGLWTTLWITLVSFAIAAVIGIIIGLMRTSGNIILSFIAQVYIDLMRGTPMIVLSFFIYFGIPQLTGWTFGAVGAGITTLSINAAAYIAEIVRGGINAVDVGQDEAARSLGLNKSKTMRRIILPQAFRIMIPSFINQFVITLKDTSILSVIGLVELTQTGRIIIARTYQSGAMWLIVGLMYIILITILTKISNRLEKDV